MRQLLLDIAPPPAPSLANFVAGPNGEALAAVRQLLQDGERLLLWGEPGSGKTHLAQATAAALGGTYWCVGQPLPAAASIPLLAVDDVHAATEDEQAWLFAAWVQAESPVQRWLITADRTPVELPIRADLRTRLSSVLAVRLLPLSDDQRAAALRAHAHSRGFELDGDAIAYLLKRVARDLSSLMALLDRIDRYTLQAQRRVSLPLLRDLLHDSEA